MKQVLKKNYKKIISFFVVFRIISLWNLLLNIITGDEIWNYGFAHSIYKGLIPYKDFNMVITPFYPFLLSLPLHIFGSSILVVDVFQSLIVTIIFFLIYEKIKEKTYLVTILFFAPLPIVAPSYNIFMLLLYFILLLLEEKKSNDYLIGVILAISVLTKQSIGVCLILPSLFYLKTPKKILKRFIGFLGPMIIFLIYLICTKSFNQFVDLCFLGLFDFSEKNGRGLTIPFFITIILGIVMIIFTRKHKGKISNYYTLAFLSMAVPIFDIYHVQMTVLVCLYQILSLTNFKLPINYKLFGLATICIVSVFFAVDNFSKSTQYPNDINHFEYKLLYDETIKFIKEINEYVENNKDKEFVYVTSSAYSIKLINDQPINWFDLMNDGNWGYNGEEKMLKAIKKKKDAVFIVNKGELKEDCQLNNEVIKYVMKNGKKIDSLRFYDVYVFE